MKPDFGRGDLMAVASVRYCLGRSTYIVRDCADWLIRNWHHFDVNTKFVIGRDVEAAFDNNDVGMDCDRREWEKVSALWATHHQLSEPVPVPSPAENPPVAEDG